MQCRQIPQLGLTTFCESSACAISIEGLHIICLGDFEGMAACSVNRSHNLDLQLSARVLRLPSAEAFRQESGSPRMVSMMYAAEKVALLGTWSGSF